ncbi:hypothetical protein NHX12_005439 [Muraenolepis orangiensis]|uniref:Uncharacterized protein n=1 Tax=Muraenolepis orangiensis TaxID=630683 RepID=A0A9Q0DV16_9TELE|nr:hypothetical protein NHX12_005439 [Muraenolepis orangiensis]
MSRQQRYPLVAKPDKIAPSGSPTEGADGSLLSPISNQPVGCPPPPTPSPPPGTVIRLSGRSRELAIQAPG